MTQPTQGDVHVDTALSNISIAYGNAPGLYVADQVFPKVSVPNQSDKFYTWTRDFMFRDVVEERAPGDTYPEAALELSSTAFYCVLYHLGFPLPDEVIANQDAAVDLETEGAEFLADQFRLHREIKFVSDFFKTGVWQTDLTLSGGDQWSDFANSDPLSDIDLATQTILKDTGTEPNKLLINKETWDKLRMHPLVLDLYKHTQKAILTQPEVASALGIEEIVVSKAVKNTAAEGATFSGGFIFGKNALLLHVPSAPGLRTPAGGYTFEWERVGKLTTTIEKTREDIRDRDLLKGKTAWDQAAVGTILGYFISGAVA